MNGNKRSKRDTVENIYKSCRLGGDCPPDVVNKAERKTLADILLQIFSSVIYLGGLGIGTGKGSTGTVSVRPIPEIPSISGSVDIVAGGNKIEEIPLVDLGTKPKTTIRSQQRPFSVPLDRISVGFRPKDPTGIKPIDVVDPSSPAIVTLHENLPDSVITLGEPNLETGESVLTNVDVITDTTSIQSHPTVYQGVENELAILTVSPADPPPTEVIFNSLEPNLDPFVTVQSVAGHIDPTFNVFVDPNLTGDDIVFGEQIPLEPINPRLEFDIEEIPEASTPEQRIQRAFNRVRHFYRRHVQQVRTSNLNLLGDVARAISFGFENPAFDQEISLEFENDLSELAAAPDSDFADIQRISRPYYSKTAEGQVRVSRFGQRAGVRTRSGTVLSQDVHYFYDVSPISATDNIELVPFSDTADIIVEDPEAESIFIDELNVNSESILMNTYPDNFLIFNNMEVDDESFNYPTVITDLTYRGLPTVSDIFISEQNLNTDTTFTIPTIPYIPVEPSKATYVGSVDFYLHPSLAKRKKRKRRFNF